MNKIKKLTLLLGVALTLLTPVLGLIPPAQGRASAAPSDSAPLENQLKSYIYMRAFARCLNTTGVNASLEDIAAYKWFGSARGDTYIGYLDANYGDGEDGKLDCKDSNDGWVQDAFTVWGWGSDDPLTQACAIGFTRSDGNCMSGASDHLIDQHGAIDLFLKAVNQKFYGKSDSTALPTLSEPMKYLYYRNSFLTLCLPTESSILDTVDEHPVEDYISGKETGYEIGGDNNHFRMVDPTADSTTTYDADKDSGDHVSTRTTDDWKKNELECGYLVNHANMNARDFANYIDTHPDDPAANPTDPSTSGTGDIDVKCGGNDGWDLKNWINPLDWLSCSLLQGFTTAAQGFDNLIMGMLCINENDIFGATPTCGSSGGVGAHEGNTDEAFHNAWSVFRILALGLLAIGGLVMVISQGLGFEIFDAYTVKKTLPRILVAAIGISLSWEILQFLVMLSNGLGVGIRALIYAPFKASGIDNVILGGGESAISALFFGGAFISLGALGLLSFIGTALLAILIGFFLLVIRNIIVIMLILIAPVAIAAYILPNTEKYYKSWWDWLLKALLVFPLITAFIAIGHVFAAITTTNGGTLTSFVAFAAYFAPYFMIPLAFRFAGGLLATLGGFANDRSRGGFDRLKKARSNVSAKNLHAIAEGNRFRNNNALTRGFNRSSRAIAAAPAAGFNPTQWRSRYSGAETTKIFDEAEELRTKNSDFMAGMQDDRVLRAILNGGHRGRAGIREYLSQDHYDENGKLIQGKMTGAELDTTTGIAERMQFAGSQEAVMTAAAIQQASTGTGYRDVEEMLQTIKTASGGNRALGGKMLGSMRGAAVQSGRHDLGAAGFGTMANELGNAYDGKQIDKTKLELDAFSSVDTTSLARGRGESTRNLSEAVARHINSTEDPVERARYQAQLENFTTNARDYGALARAHEVHRNAEGAISDPKAASPAAQHEYDSHRTPRFGDERSPDNPNRPPENK